MDPSISARVIICNLASDNALRYFLLYHSAMKITTKQPDIFACLK